MHPNLSHLYENPPLWLSLCFGGVMIMTLAVFYAALRKTAPTKAGLILAGIISWLTILLVLAKSGFFLKTDSFPPRFFLVILPPVVLVISLFLSAGGRSFLDRFSIQTLTYLNTIRIPVELILYGLFIHQFIPELMTFEGRNFDILSGLTAPLAAYWASQNTPAARKKLLIWNILALLLLINIVTYAVLSAPLPLQQLAFDQPNVGVLKFPFVGLPGVIVPLVFFGHLVSIRQLTRHVPKPVTE